MTTFEVRIADVLKLNAQVHYETDQAILYATGLCSIRGTGHRVTMVYNDDGTQVLRVNNTDMVLFAKPVTRRFWHNGLLIHKMDREVTRLYDR